jgi:hypothetical protein
MHTEQHESSIQQGGLASGTGQTGKDEALPLTNLHTDRHSGKDSYFENAPRDVSCIVVPGKSHFGMSKVREATYFEKAFKIR